MEETKETTSIPEIVVNDNQVILQTIDVPIIYNSEEKFVKLQQISAGKRRDLSKKYLQTRIQGQAMTGNVDALGFQIGILTNAIVEAPFDISETMISKFPDSIIDYLYVNYNNSFGKDEEKKNK